MSYGKSQAAVIHAKLLCDSCPETCIAVASEYIYKRLIARGVPEANLIKAWEPIDNNLLIWYDEFIGED